MTREERIQRRFVAELRLSFMRLGFAKGAEPFFHCANERKAARHYHAKLYAMGVSAGVPDILVVHPFPKQIAAGAALELKSETGSASAAQRQWLKHWRNVGFFADVLKGAEACAEWGRLFGLFDEAQVARMSNC